MLKSLFSSHYPWNRVRLLDSGVQFRALSHLRVHQDRHATLAISVYFYLSISNSLSVCPAVYLYVNLFIYLSSFHLSFTSVYPVCLSVRLSVCPSVSLYHFYKHPSMPVYPSVYRSFLLFWDVFMQPMIYFRLYFWELIRYVWHMQHACCFV